MSKQNQKCFLQVLNISTAFSGSVPHVERRYEQELIAGVMHAVVNQALQCYSSIHHVLKVERRINLCLESHQTHSSADTLSHARKGLTCLTPKKYLDGIPITQTKLTLA